MPSVPTHVFCFPNGNVCCTGGPDGEQIPEANLAWFHLVCEELARRYGAEAVLKMRVLLPHTYHPSQSPRREPYGNKGSFNAVWAIPRRIHMPEQRRWWSWRIPYRWTYDIDIQPPGVMP